MKLLFADLRSKRKTWWVPHEINHVSSVTKHLFSVVCFKSRSNHRNKHPLKLAFLFLTARAKYIHIKTPKLS
jgi:hypothetical protein